jgi:hypothetical protein
MLCPLKFNAKTLDADGEIKENQCSCEKEKCGWWATTYMGKYVSGCAVRFIGSLLSLQ